MMHSSAIQKLRDFRNELYMLFGKRADALFDLCDAAVTAGLSPSMAYLSLQSVHRRGWGSLCAALAEGQIDAELLKSLLARHPLADGQPIYAVDVTTWPRCDAEASPDRGFYYHPSRHSAGQPIVAGWAYQLISQLSFARDRWTAPMDARRLHPSEEDNPVAVEPAAHVPWCEAP